VVVAGFGRFLNLVEHSGDSTAGGSRQADGRGSMLGSLQRAGT